MASLRKKKIISLSLSSVVFLGACAVRELQTEDSQEVGAETESLTVQDGISSPYTFKSPSNVVEKCAILPRMPGADYESEDKEDEQEYCKINFYDSRVGLCPKVVSTSPGTYVYKIVKSDWNQGNFENSGNCKNPKAIPDTSIEKLATFKQTMNAKSTSGTFSTSSLLYYHFSRYLDTSVSVPVSVYREMDRKEHLKRVTKLGQALTAGGMINAGWDVLAAAESNPDSYSSVFELFTKDKSKIYGVMLKAKGERYGIEFNGIRGGWGNTDSLDFQKTPGFEALKRNEPIKTAIPNAKANYGTVAAALKPRAKKASDVDFLASHVKNMPSEQLAYWMSEASEIALLDYIFSQQDRIGNIDYVWAWTYKVNDPTSGLILKHKKVDAKFKDFPVSKYQTILASMPADIKPYSPKLLQRTVLGDNDAGARAEYSNFAKSSKMLENLRHFNGKAYSRLLKLNSDLQAKGPIFQYITANFPLSDTAQIPQIVKNVQSAVSILKGACDAGNLKLDLNPKEYFLKGDVTVTTKCDGSGS